MRAIASRPCDGRNSAKQERIGMKRLLLVMNPMAGMKKANPLLTEILDVFSKAGYLCVVHMTQASGDGTQVVKRFARDVDLIVCIGGDGTFNETISGVLAAGAKTPIGYIPAGSTNDFAASLHLSKNVVEAAQDIVRGQPTVYDVGRFEERYFTYVASFGAFTKVSYATSQSVKNALGHLAYVLGGIAELSAIRSWHVTFEVDDSRLIQGDYIFGAVSNSTSVGGILTLDPKIVDMNDGKFELLLIKAPENLADLGEIVRALTAQDYGSPMITFLPAHKIRVHADAEMDWTLDGEFAKGRELLEIENIRDAVRVITQPAVPREEP